MSVNNKLRVIKLKNGDSLIAELIENTKRQLKVFRPMEIRYMHLFDSFGRRHEALVLVDWLKATTQNEFMLDKDSILGIFTPNPDIVNSYTKQKEYDDISGKPLMEGNASMMKDKTLNQMMNDIENQIKNMSNEDILKMLGSNYEEDDDDDEEEFDRLDKKSTNKVVDKNKKEKLIDEEADPSYGTNYSDWSPNLDDYLS